MLDKQKEQVLLPSLGAIPRTSGNRSAAGIGQSAETKLQPAQFAADCFAGVTVELAWATIFTAVKMLEV